MRNPLQELLKSEHLLLGQIAKQEILIIESYENEFKEGYQNAVNYVRTKVQLFYNPCSIFAKKLQKLCYKYSSSAKISRKCRHV